MRQKNLGTGIYLGGDASIPLWESGRKTEKVPYHYCDQEEHDPIRQFWDMV